VLARVGVDAGAISHEQYAVVLNTAVATMALTPLVAGLSGSRAPRSPAAPLAAARPPDTAS